jgi:hypothetical protein
MTQEWVHQHSLNSSFQAFYQIKRTKKISSFLLRINKTKDLRKNTKETEIEPTFLRLTAHLQRELCLRVLSKLQLYQKRKVGASKSKEKKNINKIGNGRKQVGYQKRGICDG